MVKHCLPGREAARQIAPGTASAEDVADRIENAAEGMTSRSAVAPGFAQVVLQTLLFGIAEVAGIGRVHAEHCSLWCRCCAYNTCSES